MSEILKFWDSQSSMKSIQSKNEVTRRKEEISTVISKLTLGLAGNAQNTVDPRTIEGSSNIKLKGARSLLG